MKNIINKDKIITIGILPIMWLIYFLFEVFSGRVERCQVIWFTSSVGRALDF